jgi:hypothetical protein
LEVDANAGVCESVDVGGSLDAAGALRDLATLWDTVVNPLWQKYDKVKQAVDWGTSSTYVDRALAIRAPV